ncbi:MAG: rod shape-determining protein RodA [candidate division WOR-3 bacterium]|nr:rod shape-determining protein RodA [candidate division WOR-3 bacterium]
MRATNFNIKENLPILITCLVLLVIGLITLYGATAKTYFIRQIVWIAIALIAMIVIYQVPTLVLENTAWYWTIISVVLLIAVLIFGQGEGAKRWFRFGWINFQPSEFAKISSILMLASYFKNRKIELNIKSIFLPVAMVEAFSILVILEPDLGTALIFLPILAVMLYWAGFSVANLFILYSPIISFICGFSLYLWIPFFILLTIIAFRRLTIPGWLTAIIINIIGGLSSPIIWSHLKEYQKARIVGFLSPWLDPQGMNWNLIQSRIAIGSGRIFGKGLLSGAERKLTFLPNRATDFIFSTLAEQFGLFGSLVVLLLYFYLISQFIKTAAKTRNQFASLTAIGLASALAYQVLVNIGMVLGLLPITGIALPFLSYGGSSLLFCFVALGIILHIKANQE